MNKKKGFTLVELLAVIVIIVILALSGYAIYNNINEAIKQKNYDSLVDIIETNAHDYFQNNNYIDDEDTYYVFVDTLIKENYVSGDDDKNITNPIDTSETLNCHLVIQDENGISVSEESYVDLDGNCVYADIFLKVGDNYKELSSLANEDGWIPAIGETYTFVLYDVINDEEKTGNFEWYVGDELKNTGSSLVLNSSEFTSGTITAKLQYDVTKSVKIDGISPVISSVSVNESGWTKSKSITASFTERGSGVEEYCISMNASSCSNWNAIIPTDNGGNTYTITVSNLISSGYLFVRDNVDNVSNSVPFTIDYIDYVEPECTYSGENTSWTSDNVTITYGCADDASGCTVSKLGTKTFSTSGATGTIDSYTITDNAGNSKVCATKTVNVYVDKCDNTYANNGSWGSCSKTCGGGTQYRTITYYSNLSGNVCSSTTKSQSCNTQACCSGYLINGTCYSTRTSLQYYCYYTSGYYYVDSVYSYCNCYTHASCGYCGGWSIFGDGTGWCCSDWWNWTSGNCCAHASYATSTDYRYETGGCTGGYSEYSSSYRKCASGYTRSGNYCYK